MIHEKIDIQFNSDQLLAIESSSSNTIVVAGAGTGKTATIVGRIDYLIENNIKPEEILVLSFTKKSAKEIQSRIKNKNNVGIQATTFHGWCVSLLKSFGHSKITILDRDDQLQLMAIARDKKPSGFPDKNNLVKIYSYCRNANKKLKEYIEQFTPNFSLYFNEISKIYEYYEVLKKERRYLDYDDLLKVAANITSSPKYSNIILNKVKYILIDEMQDTNPLQWMIIEPLIGKINLYCVGDDAQSIYAFRGSNYKFVNEFNRIVPNSCKFYLNKNYRSTNEILNLSNWVLLESEINYNKELKSDFHGQLPELHIFESNIEEAEFVANKIIESLNNKDNYSDNMILSKTKYASRHIEAALIHYKIPYKFYGGYSFMQAAHIKEIFSLFRVLSNDRDSISWVRYLTLFPNIGDVGANSFIKDFIFDTIIDLSNVDLEDKFKEPIRIYNELKGKELPYIIEKSKVFLNPIMERKWKTEWKARSADFDLLSNLVTLDMSLEDLLESAVFNEFQETLNNGDEYKDHVILSTIHSAKGLEAKTCFIFDVNPGSYPSAYAKTSEAIEEERRLLYVALTRAKESLYLTRRIDKFNNYSGAYFFKTFPSRLFNIINHVKEENIIENSEFLDDDLIFSGGIDF